METFTLKFTMPDSLKEKGKLDKIVQGKNSILLEGGKALQELLADYMRQLNSTRSKRGSNHYSAERVYEPVISDNTVSIPIAIAGITRALHDIVINPVEAQALAIPVHASAYGMQPREYNNVHPKGSPEALFHPKGKDYLAKNDNGNLVVMYILKKSVHQSQDRSLLPTDESMDDTFREAVSNAIQVILEN